MLPHHNSCRSILILIISPGLRLVVWPFHNTVLFLRWGFVSFSPKTQAGRTTLVGHPWLLNPYIRSYLPSCTPFFHLQTEDESCRVNKDPLVTVKF
jgi:hypothetical protein